MKLSIIIEGPDGVGKTTLIERLKKDLSIKEEPIHHSYIHDWKKMDDSFNKTASRLHFHGGLLVDRFIYSNLVYSTIYRNSPLASDFHKHVEIMKERAIQVFVLPSDKERWLARFQKLCKEREEMFNEEKMGEVYDMFMNVFLSQTANGHRTFLYDYEEEECYEGLLEHINNWEMSYDTETNIRMKNAHYIEQKHK